MTRFPASRWGRCNKTFSIKYHTVFPKRPRNMPPKWQGFLCWKPKWLTMANSIYEKAGWKLMWSLVCWSNVKKAPNTKRISTNYSNWFNCTVEAEYGVPIHLSLSTSLIKYSQMVMLRWMTKLAEHLAAWIMINNTCKSEIDIFRITKMPEFESHRGR